VHPILMSELAHDRHIGLRPDRTHPVPTTAPWHERWEASRARRLQRSLARAERRAAALQQQVTALAELLADVERRARSARVSLPQPRSAGTTSFSNSSIPLVSYAASGK
jgi:hypothetical protein